jgi:cell fate regulator YaaT (PSP1 superfamily)
MKSAFFAIFFLRWRRKAGIRIPDSKRRFGSVWMLYIAKVRLRKPVRVLVFTARDLNLSRGDHVIVRSDRGLESGICIVEPEECSEDIAKRYTMPVVRKVAEHDEETLGQIIDDEQKAAALCRKKICERGLPMNLVDVEYSFDRHKVIFYFTADDRVDFRELVRDLAHDLKARIELRHIQVRDKAKIVGGFAACGRELCCATWLSEFMPISMKMAKRQSLSLNPAKISGQCGRLMCCLSYENDQYNDPKKKKAAAAPEESEKPSGPEWEEILEDVVAQEEDALDSDIDIDSSPGEPVLVINPDGTEEIFEEEDLDDAASDDPNKPAKPRRSRRRRRRRKTHDGGNAAPPAAQ